MGLPTPNLSSLPEGSLIPWTTHIPQWFAELWRGLVSWRIHMLGKGGLGEVSSFIAFFCLLFFILLFFSLLINKCIPGIWDHIKERNEGRKWKHKGEQRHRQRPCSLAYFVANRPNSRLFQDYLYHDSSKHLSIVWTSVHHFWLLWEDINKTFRLW